MNHLYAIRAVRPLLLASSVLAFACGDDGSADDGDGSTSTGTTGDQADSADADSNSSQDTTNPDESAETTSADTTNPDTSGTSTSGTGTDSTGTTEATTGDTETTTAEDSTSTGATEETCNPLEQNCREGEGCYPAGDAFDCFPDASGPTGAAGDPCAALNACDPSLFCADAGLIPGCAGIGCCSPFCDVNDAMPECPAELECIAWYEEGQAPSGFENVGACVDAA